MTHNSFSWFWRLTAYYLGADESNLPLASSRCLLHVCQFLAFLGMQGPHSSLCLCHHNSDAWVPHCAPTTISYKESNRSHTGARSPMTSSSDVSCRPILYPNKDVFFSTRARLLKYQAVTFIIIHFLIVA